MNLPLNCMNTPLIYKLLLCQFSILIMPLHNIILKTGESIDINLHILSLLLIFRTDTGVLKRSSIAQETIVRLRPD